jgi:long-chain acyl-CoA synthetase
MKTIVRMLHEAAVKFPTRAYTTKKTDEGWKPYTYPEVDMASDQVAAYFIAQGFTAESSFGVLAEGRPEWVMAEMGVLKARCVSVPLSIKLTADEIAFRLTHSEAKGIIASSNTLDNVCKALDTMAVKPMLIYLDEDDERLQRQKNAHHWKAGKDFLTWDTLLATGTAILQRLPMIVKDSEAKINENDTVNICYTSGTTGNPKGIMLSHLNYWANSHDAVELFHLPEETF